MKKIIAAMLLCVASSTAFAQTEKGTQNIGASFAIQNSDLKTSDLSAYGTSKTKYEAYLINLNYSYFIADKLDIGFLAGYGFQQNKQDYEQSDDYSSKVNNLLVGVQLRKYILFNDKIGIRTGPAFQYQRDKQTNAYSSTADQVTTTDSYTGRLGLDFVFYPMKNLGITSNVANISYTHSKFKGYNTGSSNGFGANFVNNLNLGFFYSW